MFALELEGIRRLTTVKISGERLAQLQKATEQDPVMQTLKTTILTGWPTQRDEVPVHIRELWNCRDELTLHNGVLFKNQRLIIPKAILTLRSHSTHTLKPPWDRIVPLQGKRSCMLAVDEQRNQGSNNKLFHLRRVPS